MDKPAALDAVRRSLSGVSTTTRREGSKPSTIARHLTDIVWFEKWLFDRGHPAFLESLERTIRIADRHHLPATATRRCLRAAT